MFRAKRGEEVSCNLIVLYIAAFSASLFGRDWLAVEYDAVARKDWSDRAYAGEYGFDVSTASWKLKPELLLKAKVIFCSCSCAVSL